MVVYDGRNVRPGLAIVAVDLPSSILRTHFPTVTDYQIKAARKHAYRYGENFFQLLNWPFFLTISF